MDFNFITDHLATGAGLGDEADVEELGNAGITHVLDCRAEFDDAVLFANHPALLYCWNGTADDGQHKPTEWFAKGLAFAIPALAVAAPAITVPPAMHARVYCHCAGGINRGPSMAFAIMCALDWPYDLAEARIRQQRPKVGLAYKDDAIAALTALGF